MHFCEKKESRFSRTLTKLWGYLYFFRRIVCLEDAVCVILLRIQNGLTHKIVSQFIDVQKRRALWDLKHIGRSASAATALISDRSI